MTDRQEFEAWMKGLSGYPFAGQFANLMWSAWQAARATADHIGEATEKVSATAEQDSLDAKRYRWLRRRAVMIDRSDEVSITLTLFKDEGPTGEFLDDQVDTEIRALKSQQDAAIESQRSGDGS